MTKRQLLLVLGLLTAGLGLIAVVRWYGADLSPLMVREGTARLGGWGPFVLVGLLAAVLVVPFIPASVLQLGAGLAFGPVIGFILVMIADLLGASAGFLLARRWGRRLVEPRLSSASHAMLARLARRMDYRMVMILRLLPGPAYPLVSFAAGYSDLPFGIYTLASIIGVAPSLGLLVFAGDIVVQSPFLAFGIVAALIGSLALAGRLVRSPIAEDAAAATQD